MPAPPYGQFGSSSYPYQTIPKNIGIQYPGSKDLRASLGTFGRLAFGGGAAGLGNIAAAQASDPYAEEFQSGAVTGGGAFATPGAASGAFGRLTGEQMGAEATRQKVTDQATDKALSGISDVGNYLAQNIYGKQSADISLEQAQNEAEAAKVQGAMQLTNELIDLFFAGKQLMGGGGSGQTFDTSSPMPVSGTPNTVSPVSAGQTPMSNISPQLSSMYGQGMQPQDVTSLFSSLGYGQYPGLSASASGIDPMTNVLPFMGQ